MGECENGKSSNKAESEQCLGDNTGSMEVSSSRSKESSNDMCSEVLNSTPDDSSIRATASQVIEVFRSNQVCDLMSNSSGNSCINCFSNEEGTRDRTSGVVSTSHVSLEIPKHASSSGVRKITFKFSKTEPQFDYYQSSCHDHLSGGSFEDGGDTRSLSCAVNSESRISHQVSWGKYPITVKKLLSCGILEGARVKYTSSSHEKALCGIISGSGYLCGCSVCNFSEVISGFEFELHAGGKTRHPNHHIYLENGRSIRSIVDELKTAPFSELDEMIVDILGPAINKKFFESWRENFHEINAVEATKKRRLESIPRANSISQPRRDVTRSRTKRDFDLHRLLFMPNGLPDGTELVYIFKQQAVLFGSKKRNGIFCSHCNCKVSPSQFEAHAGYAARRQPYRHIFVSNGLSLHDIAISLANGRSLGTGSSDDMCTICGDGGHLVACHGCPRAFHADCLGLQYPPDVKWYCQHCRVKAGSRRKSRKKACTRRSSRAVEESASEHGGCAVCGADDFSSAVFDTRTIIICDQCEREFHVGCLRESGCCDLQELPKDDWFCTDDCRRICNALQNLVSSSTEIIPEYMSNSIMQRHIGRNSVEGGGIDIQWRILNGKSRQHEHLWLLSQATSIFRDCFDPILTISGRDLIPVMVYGRNISGQEFGGMYCVVLIVNSVVVSACLLRIFGREVAELPLVATSVEYQGNGYFQALFSCVQCLLASLKVEALVLPASEDSESFWKRKFGFRTMSNAQLLKYRSFQFTMFKKTTMLEREVLADHIYLI